VSSEPDPSVGEPGSYREQVERPLLGLFLEYGAGSRRWFGLGLATSALARFLSQVPPAVLGAAVDGIFRGEARFALRSPRRTGCRRGPGTSCGSPSA
jgi:hypothetical protein